MAFLGLGFLGVPAPSRCPEITVVAVTQVFEKETCPLSASLLHPSNRLTADFVRTPSPVSRIDDMSALQPSKRLNNLSVRLPRHIWTALPKPGAR